MELGLVGEGKTINTQSIRWLVLQIKLNKELQNQQCVKNG